jgi:hypothetical protein
MNNEPTTIVESVTAAIMQIRQEGDRQIARIRAEAAGDQKTAAIVASPFMDVDDPLRGTGRTTQQLEEARRVAKSGTEVLFVCPTMHSALTILAAESINNLKFASPHSDDAMRNLVRGRSGIVIVDHACPESFHEIAREISK